MKTKTTSATAAPDTFVPDSAVRQELNASTMTLWRWDHDPAMIAFGWPPPVKIGNRKHRSRHQLEQFKKNLMMKAAATRGGRGEAR
jgi:hypothetical protein